MCGRGEGAAGDLGEESGCGPDTDSKHTGQDRVKRVSKNSLFYLKRHLVFCNVVICARAGIKKIPCGKLDRKIYGDSR